MIKFVLIFVLCLAATNVQAFASEHKCVVQLTIFGTKRIFDAAVGEATSKPKVHPTIGACNASSLSWIVFLAENMEAEAFDVVDAVSVQCVVPDDCNPEDLATVEPDFLVYMAAEWRAGLSYREALSNRLSRFNN